MSTQTFNLFSALINGFAPYGGGGDYSNNARAADRLDLRITGTQLEQLGIAPILLRAKERGINISFAF